MQEKRNEKTAKVCAFSERIIQICCSVVLTDNSEVGHPDTWGISIGNCEVFSTLSPKVKLVMEASKATLKPSSNIFFL